jgi:hypothetical protein
MLIRKATYFTPELQLENGILRIIGKLWMENPSKYFEKIFIYTKKSDSALFKVIMEVEHINSSSSKQVLEYFKYLNELMKTGKFKQVHIQWKIVDKDEDLVTLIHDIEYISELNIEIITDSDAINN